MNTTLATIQKLLIRDLKGIQNEIQAFPSDERVWSIQNGVTNSSGVLAMHGCGNLNHFIGHVLGRTGYVRDRPLEFSKQDLSRSAICEEIGRTIEMLSAVLPSLNPTILSESYPEKVGGLNLNTQAFLLHLCTHLSFHLGQVGYLRRMLTGDNTSVNPVSFKDVAMLNA